MDYEAPEGILYECSVNSLKVIEKEIVCSHFFISSKMGREIGQAIESVFMYLTPFIVDNGTVIILQLLYWLICYLCIFNILLESQTDITYL